MLLASILLAEGAFGSSCIEAASRCTWSQQPKCSTSVVVNDVGSERMRRDVVELVVAHSADDITWSDPYEGIRSVYARPATSQGRDPARATVKLHDGGLEQYSCASCRGLNHRSASRLPLLFAWVMHGWPQDTDCVPKRPCCQMCATLSTTTTRSLSAPCSCRAGCRRAASLLPMVRPATTC